MAQTLFRRQKKKHKNCEPKRSDLAASYSRYSSDNQDPKSIPDQQRECREFATPMGLPIDSRLEMFDSAISGTLLRRDGLDRVIAAAKNGEFGTLFFYSLSRLARESVISMSTLKLLVYVYKIRVISVTEGLDTANKGWEITASFLSLHHEQFIKDLSAGVHRGQVSALLANFSVGDYRFGYRSVPSPGGEKTGRGRNVKPRMVYQIDEEQSAWVRKIFEWFVNERRSLNWIRRELNRFHAPTDHRSSTKTWSSDSVRGLLRSVKYVGFWPWGETIVDRNPLTGKPTQKPRPSEETDGWMRRRPDLRLVSDETFIAAQKILDANAEQCAKHRNSDGWINGSPAGKEGRRLLSGLIQCEACESKFYIGGTNGKYLKCCGARAGLCSCNTHLAVKNAEKMILDAIASRILRNEQWVQALFQACRCTWEQRVASRPDDLQKIEASIVEVKRKIDRLVDRLEESDLPDPSIKERLIERRATLADLESRRLALESQPAENLTPPTREWIVDKLENLGQVICSTTTAANRALRSLLTGPIVVKEIPVPGRKRCFWQGTLSLTAEKVAAAVVPSLAPSDACSGTLSDIIVIEFKTPSKTEHQGVRAWELYQQGLPIIDIARDLEVSKPRINVILKAAALERGEPYVDGRKRRSTLKHKTVDQSVHDQLLIDAKRLYDDDLPMQDIATVLDVCRDTVTKLISEWHEAHGLTMEDGRARRARLNNRGANPPS